MSNTNWIPWALTSFGLMLTAYGMVKSSTKESAGALASLTSDVKSIMKALQEIKDSLKTMLTDIHDLDIRQSKSEEQIKRLEEELRQLREELHQIKEETYNG